LESLAERRQFGRLKIAEPRICRVHVPQSQELWVDQGILVNISLGGIYLICNKQPPFEKDDIRFLTLNTPYPDPETHHLGLHVLVVRTEQTQIERHQFAVALRIISDPVYYSLQESNQRKFTSSDKARIMYQYYNLNKKAYEIINNTPDIRPDKIRNIKNMIDSGFYKIKSEKITQGVIKEMFLEKIFL
jgi:anti-sigma28 factor (negative regulator of flagellin synthesis)